MTEFSPKILVDENGRPVRQAGGKLSEACTSEMIRLFVVADFSPKQVSEIMNVDYLRVIKFLNDNNLRKFMKIDKYPHLTKVEEIDTLTPPHI